MYNKNPCTYNSRKAKVIIKILKTSKNKFKTIKTVQYTVR